MIRIKGRRMVICENDRQIAVESDNKTETKTFCLNRLYRGVDLSQFGVWLLSENAAGEVYSLPLEMTVEDDRLVLLWQVDSRATRVAGILRVCIKFARNENDETLIWQSHIGEFEVVGSIDQSKDSQVLPDTLLEEAMATSLVAKDEAVAAAQSAKEDAQALENATMTCTAAASSCAYNADICVRSAQDAVAAKDSMAIEYDVDGTRVGFKRADETEFTYTDDLSGGVSVHPVAITSSGNAEILANDLRAVSMGDVGYVMGSFFIRTKSGLSKGNTLMVGSVESAYMPRVIDGSGYTVSVMSFTGTTHGGTTFIFTITSGVLLVVPINADMGEMQDMTVSVLYRYK